jgi:hypothetical protein
MVDPIPSPGWAGGYCLFAASEIGVPIPANAQPIASHKKKNATGCLFRHPRPLTRSPTSALLKRLGQ